jgi:hypothetical protein
MRQVNVSLPDDLRAKLDAAAGATNRGLAEEIRDRLAQSFTRQEWDPQTQMLLAKIGHLAFLMRPQTGHDWHAHPFTHHVFRDALEILLDRRKPAGEPVLDPAELPLGRPVVTTDAAAMAIALEAIVSLDRPLQADAQIDRQLAGGPTTLLEVSRKKEEEKKKGRKS